MPRIQTVPVDQLNSRARAMLEEGMAVGVYPLENGEMPATVRTLAYSTAALEAAHARSMTTWQPGLLGGRLRELLRIRSAQINGCSNCASVVKADGVSGDDAVCMIDLDYSKFTARETAGLKYVTKFGGDHHAIGDADIQALLVEFSPAEVVELIQLAGSLMGVHRMYSVLQVLSDCEPLIRFDPSLVDASLTQAEAAE